MKFKHTNANCASTISKQISGSKPQCKDMNWLFRKQLLFNYIDSVRGRWWWYNSGSWTFPTIFCYILLPRDRWQLRGSLTKWHLIWKGVRCVTDFLHAEKMTFIDTWLMFMETNQWMWAQWGGGWCVSAVATATVITLDGADFYQRSMQALVHCWQ